MKSYRLAVVSVFMGLGFYFLCDPVYSMGENYTGSPVDVEELEIKVAGVKQQLYSMMQGTLGFMVFVLLIPFLIDLFRNFIRQLPFHRHNHTRNVPVSIADEIQRLHKTPLRHQALLQGYEQTPNAEEEIPLRTISELDLSGEVASSTQDDTYERVIHSD